METCNLFSGIIGALIGVAITVILYWHSRYISTKRALIDRLSILKHDVFWNCYDQDIFRTWDVSLKEIWLLYNAVFDFVPFWKRTSMQNAWGNYKGEDCDTVKKLSNQGIIVDSKMAPKNKDEFLHRINSFLQALKKSP